MVGQWAAHSAGKKAATKADHSVARWVATTVVTTGDSLVAQKVARRVVKKAGSWVVQ